MIMTDQDHDGSHIKGLIINFIHHFWPSLLKINGFVKEFITPLIKATKGKNILSFYTVSEYRNWVDSLNGNTKGWHIKYYKGLGTSSNKEGKEYFAEIDKHKKDFVYEDRADEDAIELAFGKSRSDDRKNWLASFDPSNSLQDGEYSEISYKDFINKELILFSLADNQRSIPSVCDGLKPSERKILFACIKRKLKEEIKVAQLAGYVAEHSAYHHGDQSLHSTIIAMAQNFVGANNINLLMPIGQYGTRHMGGKDVAAARYINTNLSKLTRHLFNANDDPLMEYLNDEGQDIEPKWYLPIIPMLLINGAEGIGTGWSTHIPCFNPREIVENIKNKIKTGSFFEMKPWYKGFKGRIELNENRDYNVTGIFEWKDDTLIITELPIKKWTRKYKEMLEGLMGIEAPKETKEKEKKKKNNEEVEEKKEQKEIIIEDFKEYHTDSNICFEIKIIPKYLDSLKDNPDKVIKKFKLQTTIALSNMVCFDPNGKIRKYNSVIDIMEEFYDLRRNFYEKRKLFKLSELEKELKILNNKVKFILDVIDEKIKIKNVHKKVIIVSLFEAGFTPKSKIDGKTGKKNQRDANENKENEEDDQVDKEEDDNDMPVPSRDFEYLLSMPLWSLTYERVKDLQRQKKEKEQEWENLYNTSIDNIWMKDLDEFLQVLAEVEKIEEEERLGEGILKKKTKSGKGQRGAKKTDVDKSGDPIPQKKAKNGKNDKTNKMIGEKVDDISDKNIKHGENKVQKTPFNKEVEQTNPLVKNNPFTQSSQKSNDVDTILPFKERLAMKSNL